MRCSGVGREGGKGGHGKKKKNVRRDAPYPLGHGTPTEVGSKVEGEFDSKQNRLFCVVLEQC